jgi:hypothetical protein
MPTPKQMAKLAATVGREPSRTPNTGPGDAMPPEYWKSLPSDPYADKTSPRSRSGVRTQRLAEVQQHLLRVGCRRCGRTIEIQKADAIRLAGAQAVWKDVGQRLLDDTCSERTGSYEDDGCWPSFE